MSFSTDTGIRFVRPLELKTFEILRVLGLGSLGSNEALANLRRCGVLCSMGAWPDGHYGGSLAASFEASRERLLSALSKGREMRVFLPLLIFRLRALRFSESCCSIITTN